MPEFPPSPAPQSPKHGRDMSKGFFSNFMASKSSHKLQPSEANIQEGAEKADARSRASSKDRSLHSVKKQESTPELPRLGQGNGVTNDSNLAAAEYTTQRTAPETTQGHKKAKSKLGGILARTKTVRMEDTMGRQKTSVPSHLQLETKPSTSDQLEPSPKTAPIKSDYRDKTLGNEGAVAIRNRSADRQIREESAFARRDRQTTTAPLSSSLSSSFREGSTLQILSNIGHSGKGMGDRLGKAGKGFLGKITRSGSSNEHEPVTDDNYVCTTINLPLVKQTRKTRIARRLELSKDKTEFWMPALPWRCIEYVDLTLE